MNRRGKTKEGFLQVKQPSRFGKVSIMRKVFLIVGFHGVATFLPAYIRITVVGLGCAVGPRHPAQVRACVARTAMVRASYLL